MIPLQLPTSNGLAGCPSGAGFRSSTVASSSAIVPDRKWKNLWCHSTPSCRELALRNPTPIWACHKLIWGGGFPPSQPEKVPSKKHVPIFFHPNWAPAAKKDRCWARICKRHIHYRQLWSQFRMLGHRGPKIDCVCFTPSPKKSKAAQAILK